MDSSSSSSSSSFCTPQVKYDVFLSFRGEDTRENFISHLHTALCHEKIETFIDNELVRGDEISPSLLNAIERSKISVIIFSKGYASSRWCLEELVKILECKGKYNQVVLPVFYHIDPSHVRNQTGPFVDAFTRHEEHFKERLVKVQRWRSALTEAANLSGFDSSDIRPESKLIKEIVQDILKRLRYMSPSDNEEIFGVESSIKVIESLLDIGSNEKFAVGIWGIGSIGKTTIASIVFNRISSQFEGSYFAQNIREELENPNGLTHLRKEFLSTLLKDRNLYMGTPNVASPFIKNKLRSSKVLIVCDDVTCSEQIRVIIGKLEDLGPGSRLIVTTRDRQVLKNYEEDKIYQIMGLPDNFALQLFSCYAFKQNWPMADYWGFSNGVVRCAKGVPLALKVLGSLLQDRKKEDWESVIDKLENSPLHENVFKVLKISYDGLDDKKKEIFLDIACFFKGWDKNLVKEILDASGFYTQIELSILIDKSLIDIIDNKITMHDSIQEMGRNIVEQESKDPGKRSRLWHHDDIYRVLTKNKGTEATEGISLDMSKVKDIRLDPHSFVEMHKLRFFNLYSSNFSFDEKIHNNKVHAFQGLEFVSTELTYFCWLGCPLKSLSSNFDAEKLVILNMCRSNVEQLWDGIQDVVNLKHIYLSHSKHLKKIPDLSSAQNLQSLILNGCTSLFEINTPPSPEYLNKLVNLDLRDCKSLICLPTGLQSKSLTYGKLSGCLNLQVVPMISCNMERLYLDGTSVRELSLIEYPSRLVELNLRNCSRLESLPSSVCELKYLDTLILFGCLKLERLPDNLENLEALSFLDLSYCVRLQSLPKLPRGLDVQAYNCSSLESLSDLSFILSPKLRVQKVNFANCFKMNQSFRLKLKDTLQKYPHEEFNGASSAMICFPGDEIPEWFGFQSMGSSTTLELQPDKWINKNFLGFLLCAVVAFPGNNIKVGNDFLVRCTLTISNRDGWIEQSIYLWNAGFGPNYFESDHVFLGYDLLICSPLDERFANKVSIKFQANYPHFEVKKCGAHLLYGHDCWEPMGESSRGFNYDEDEGEGEGEDEDDENGKLGKEVAIAWSMVYEEKKKGMEADQKCRELEVMCSNLDKFYNNLKRDFSTVENNNNDLLKKFKICEIELKKEGWSKAASDATYAEHEDGLRTEKELGKVNAQLLEAEEDNTNA